MHWNLLFQVSCRTNVRQLISYSQHKGSVAYLGITAVVYDWFRRQIRTPQEPIVYNTITSTARDLRDPGTWAGMAVLVGIVFGLAWLCGIFQKRE